MFPSHDRGSLRSASSINNEIQVISGFDELENVSLKYLNWYDTGNNDAYEKARKKFSNEVVANKTNEALFIDNGKVIKYFDDTKKAKMRYDRSLILKGLCPKVKMINENMYSYDFIEGELLSNFKDYRVFKRFLAFYKENFLKRSVNQNSSFLNDCYKMYESKTVERISSFKDIELDKISTINGVKVPSIKTTMAGS